MEDFKDKHVISDTEHDLLSMLTDQILEAELIWNFFLSTCEDYKIDSLLRPFPKMFIQDCGDKMIDKLRFVLRTIFNLNEVLVKLNSRSLRPDAVALLNWVLRSEAFKLRAISRNNFSDILGTVQKVTEITAFPRYIFEVDSREKARYRRFQALADQYGSRFAFHGSRVENYFSILHNGLQVSMNKVGAFGPGIYLSSDLGVSLNYSPSGMGCPGSIFGDTFGVVALCEIVDHPDVKCQHETDSKRKYAAGLRSAQVPHKYFIVQNSDMVQVRYLLVYSGYSRSAIQKGLSTRSVKLYGCLILFIFIVIYNSQVLIRFFKKIFMTVDKKLH